MVISSLGMASHSPVVIRKQSETYQLIDVLVPAKTEEATK